MVGSRAQRRCHRAEPLTLRRERVDAIPLWLAQLDRLGLQPRRAEQLPTHGHGVGRSLGWMTVLGLPHLLSAAEHRLPHVHPGAAQRLQTLRGATGHRVHPLDLSDDRRAGGLEAWREHQRWQALASACTQHLLRVDDRQPVRVRLESPTASGYGCVTDDGRFPCGQSQAHRLDLPPVQVMLSALAPLGVPVATDIGPGLPLTLLREGRRRR